MADREVELSTNERDTNAQDRVRRRDRVRREFEDTVSDVNEG